MYLRNLWRQPKQYLVAWSSLLFFLIVANAAADDSLQPAVPATSVDHQTAEPLTVAIVGFEAIGGREDLGRMIHGTLEAMLSGQAGLRLADRQTLDQTLAEASRSLSGTTDPALAIEVGRMVGARLLVSGKAFELGESRMLTAKIIGSETTLTESVVVKGELDEPLDTLVFELAESLVKKLRAAGPQLVAGELPADPVPGLLERLQQRDLPVFAVVIPEEHRGVRLVTDPPDPAVETELKRLLIAAGAEVRDVHNNALAEWITAFESNGQTAWPRTLEGVDVVVIGEAFSESAGQLGQLRLASARTEINAIERESGRIIFVDRTTTRGINLAEEIAGKSALEKAGRVIGQRLLEQLLIQDDQR
ncbi:MAG: hypothetical protein AAGJ38_02965 [Planctomycetota bacterium]